MTAWLKLRDLALGLAFLLLAGCGGGGGGGGSSSTTTTTTTTSVNNVVAITVDRGPVGNSVNQPYISVTVCVPGTSTCQTIDRVLVDTGSTGLRLFASAFTSHASFPQLSSGGGNPLAECAVFASGWVWGPVRQADIVLSGERASSVPIQVGADPAYATVPATCSSRGASRNSISSFGANGIIGVGIFTHDCGVACAAVAIPGAYYGCVLPVICASSTVAQSSQVQNPVALFSSDNNGVLIDLPAVANSGAATVTGSLIFGIGTQSNNALGSAGIYTVTASTGTLTTVFNGQTLTTSFIDSGSNGLYFPYAGTPICGVPASGFYCPAATQSLSAVIQGRNAVTGTVNFSLANAINLVNATPTFAAYPALGGDYPGSTTTFDWGLPFFYGRRVFTAISGASTSAGTGPFIAF